MTKRLTLALLAALVLGAAAPALQTVGIPLTELGAEPFEALQGPYDEVRLTFQVPPDWRLQEGSTLDLSLQNFFSSFVPAQAEVTQEELIAGNLSISIDGNLVQREVLSQNGEFLLSIPLSPDVFTASRFEHELAIAWDASASCDLNLSSTIIVDPASSLFVSHTEGIFSANLADLPFPFFASSSLAQPETLIVLPSSPTELQLSAALTLAAGLGRDSSDAIVITKEDQLAASSRATSHLVFVGPVASFSALTSAVLPHESASLPTSGDVGFVDLIASPWNDQRGLLVVSGNTDQAIANAALQVSSGALLINTAGNFALVEGAPLLQAPADTETATLSQLGQGDLTFDRYGRSEFSLSFYIDPARPISQQAFLDLRFAHSELIDYLRSGLSLSLNGSAISSIRLSDQTAARHSEVVLLPPTLLRPGWNQLSGVADVLPLDLCASEEESAHWLSIYGDSSLNLPTAEAALEETSPASLGNLAPFFANSMQGTSLFVSQARPDAWSQAGELLRAMARQTWPLLPQVRFSENAVPSTEPAILFGWFDDFATLVGGSAAFSVDTAGQKITLSSGAQIPYDPSVRVGLLQAAQLGDASVLAVWGNSTSGLAGAANLLASPGFEQNYHNASLVVVQGENVIRDEGTAAPEQAEEQAETTNQAAPVSDGKGIYLYLLLILLFLALGLIVWEQIHPYVKKQVRRFRSG